MVFTGTTSRTVVFTGTTSRTVVSGGAYNPYSGVWWCLQPVQWCPECTSTRTVVSGVYQYPYSGDPEGGHGVPQWDGTPTPHYPGYPPPPPRTLLSAGACPLPAHYDTRACLKMSIFVKMVTTGAWITRRQRTNGLPTHARPDCLYPGLWSSLLFGPGLWSSLLFGPGWVC